MALITIIQVDNARLRCPIQQGGKHDICVLTALSLLPVWYSCNLLEIGLYLLARYESIGAIKACPVPTPECGNCHVSGKCFCRNYIGNDRSACQMLAVPEAEFASNVLQTLPVAATLLEAGEVVSW